MNPIPYPGRFPPAGFTAGHSAGHGGRPETYQELLERAHSTILSVARNRVHYCVLQGMTEDVRTLLVQKRYSCRWITPRHLPKGERLLLVTWEPR